jgi:hypothetical protein
MSYASSHELPVIASLCGPTAAIVTSTNIYTSLRTLVFIFEMTSLILRRRRHDPHGACRGGCVHSQQPVGQMQTDIATTRIAYIGHTVLKCPGEQTQAF